MPFAKMADNWSKLAWVHEYSSRIMHIAELAGEHDDYLFTEAEKLLGALQNVDEKRFRKMVTHALAKVI